MYICYPRVFDDYRYATAKVRNLFQTMAFLSIILTLRAPRLNNHLGRMMILTIIYVPYVGYECSEKRVTNRLSIGLAVHETLIYILLDFSEQTNFPVVFFFLYALRVAR